MTFLNQPSVDERTREWVTTIIDELNSKLSDTSGLEDFRLNGNCIELNRIANNDLILDLSSHEAVKDVALEYFTELGEDVTMAALQVACRYNWKKVVDLLIQKIHPNESPLTGDAPLIIAATFNFTSIVKTLVERGADVTKVDSSGKTALHLAAQHGNKDLCEYLLGKPNVDVNGKDFGKKTPLHLAMLSGQRGKKAASFLITKNADILWEDQGKRSAIEIAAGEGDDKIIKILIDSVSDRYDRSIQDKMDEALFIAAGAGYEKVVTMLADNGANVNYVSGEKEGKLSALHVAAINGQQSIVEILLSKGANESAVDHRTMTPLHRACRNGHLEIVKMDVWKNPTHLSAVDEAGNTPLLLAVSRGKDDVVSYMIDLHIQLGVELDIADHKGYNMIHKAVIAEQTRTLEQILTRDDLPIISSLVNGKDNKYNRTPLHYAAMLKRNEELVQLLTTNGAQVLLDSKGKTPVHVAARFGHINCIRHLEQAKIGNVDEVDGKGRHIVHQAAKSRQLTLITRHSRPKDFTLKDARGWTPLHYAAQQGNVDTIDIIIDKFHDPNTIKEIINQVNKKNETPLHLACREGNIECINILLDNGADVSVKTKQFETAEGITGGKTCLDEAVMKGQVTIWRLIINHKSTSDMLWEDKKFICDISILIKCFPYSNAAKELLDICCTEESDGTKTYCFGILDKVEDDTDRTPERYFAPSLMETENKDELITHEVTAQLILSKWNGFGRWLYLLWACISVLYTSLLTVLIVDAKETYKYYGNTSNQTFCTMALTTKNATVIPYILLPISIVYLLLQTAFLVHLRTRYITFINFGRFLISIFTFLFILPYVACHYNEFRELFKGQDDLQVQFGAIAILLSWVNMMFYFRHFFYGIYVIMLVEVLRSWMRSIVVFAILIIGFALSFYCVLDEEHAFKDPGNSIIKTLVWFIGEISYEDTFIESTLKYKQMATCILVLFFISMNVAFINLLVGVAVGDINLVREKAYLILLREKIHAIEVLYSILPARVRKFLHRSIYTVGDGCLFQLSNRFGNVGVKDLQNDQKKKSEFRRVAMRAAAFSALSPNRTDKVNMNI